MTDGPAAREPDPRPRLTIVSGQLTPEETAAVTVVLTALLSQPTAEARPVPSQWSARSRFLRAPVTPGPGAWRASALPR
ncbi:MAG: acyl-CoA carboxylase subunit epsilon [Streptosporangiaceae bacterium]